MKVVKIIGIVILLTSSWVGLDAQKEVDYLQSMEEVFEVKKARTNYLPYLERSGNPVEFIFSTLFVGYKYLISSQDMGSCVFHPSCSVYGIESIQKNGLIMGGMATFDRLTRCHPFAPNKYDFDPQKLKYYDPVD